jgi:hypothetical protein
MAKRTPENHFESVHAARLPCFILFRLLQPLNALIQAAFPLQPFNQAGRLGCVHALEPILNRPAPFPHRGTQFREGGQPVATETNIVISFFSDDAISMSFPPGILAIH